MEVTNNFIVNAPAHLVPLYRISPFQNIDTKLIKRKRDDSKSDIEKYFKKRFLNKDVKILTDGRGAISLALDTLNLNKDDVVTIYTTTNKPYISKCVTNEIEKYCLWSRNLENKTKVIFVNHEFGYCCQTMKKYSLLGLPIIEDFAHSFISNSDLGDAGYYGDFLIFSLTKFFQTQVGGVLVHNKSYNVKSEINSDLIEYINRSVSPYLNSVSSIRQKRLDNYNYYLELFSKIGLSDYFHLHDNDCPGVFCVEFSQKLDLDNLKNFMSAQGIESSVFYGENAYFLPCHQNLNKDDIEYIYSMMKFFIERTL